MRKAIFETIQFPQWAKNDVRYQALDELDRYLDGEIYDHFDYVFYDEEVNGAYVKIKRRRPSVRFNLYAALADQIGRECFAGYNAPVIQHPKEKVRMALDALKEETEALSNMIELTNWATTGSSVATFKVVAFGKDKAKAVMTNRRAKDCTPFFNELNELAKLRVHYVTSGSFLLSQQITWDYEGTPLKADRSYWFVRDYGAGYEETYYPIAERRWKPIDVNSDRLVPINNIRHTNDLDFVPSHWFRRRTGKIRPYDGRCVWEHAIPNIIEFDYSMSMMGAGVRYNASPQVVIKGKILNAGDDGRFIGGPSRYLHFAADHKDPDDGLSQTGSDAHLLEATGNGMAVAIERYGPMLKEIATISICGSRKDPNKITTAMSAKGMEVLDKEYHNLIQEFRTVCGDNGYLKLLKKMGAACIISRHPLFKDITLEDLDGATLKWPPINPVGAQEFLYLCQGAAQLLQATEAPPVSAGADGVMPEQPEDKEAVMTRGELRSYIVGSIDHAIDSTNKDYLMLAEAGDKTALEPAKLTAAEVKMADETGEMLNRAEEAIKATQREQIDTSFKVGEG